MKFIKRFESYEIGMSREEMCNMLSKMGYEMSELEVCSDSELVDICRNSEMSNESETMSREEKCDMLMACGYSRSELDVCSDEKLSMMYKNAQETEMMKTKNESKIRYKKGIRENRKQNNYMFFSNLEAMKNMIDDLLQMDKSKMDSMLDEHDWASDHISVANENLEHVYNFFKKSDDYHNQFRDHPMSKMENKVIKKFK